MIRHKPETGFLSFGGWAFKKSFIPSSRTNFNKGVTCPDEMYKFGALCYPLTSNRKSCDEIGY